MSRDTPGTKLPNEVLSVVNCSNVDTVNISSLKRALITGGTSGLGATFAQALAERGVDLVLVARDAERLAKRKQELEKLGVVVETLTADLATKQGVADVKKRLICEESPIGIFINNAGAGMYSPMATLDATELRAGAELMALVPMELGGAAAYVMKQRGEGLILTTASVAAYAPMGAYSAVKAFVKLWSESLANEVGKFGVNVTLFVPGWVRTEFHQRSGVSTSSIPSWLWLEARRVVDEALADAEKGKTISVPSKRFKMVASLATHVPRPLVNKVVKKLNKGRR